MARMIQHSITTITSFSITQAIVYILIMEVIKEDYKQRRPAQQLKNYLCFIEYIAK